MPNETAMHPAYRAINKPLTIWGAERRLFFLALVMGAATFNFFGSLFSGILMFLSLYLAARWATKVDPQILRILLNATKFRNQYDPGKREPFEIEVHRHGA
jgi:type IV secretory pathway TrbD component